MKAKHEHDCDECELIAVTDQADWYLCPRTAIGDHTMIGRYSSDGPDYWSCSVDIIKTGVSEGSTFMTEARRILADLDLLTLTLTVEPSQARYMLDALQQFIDNHPEREDDERLPVPLMVVQEWVNKVAAFIQAVNE